MRMPYVTARFSALGLFLVFVVTSFSAFAQEEYLYDHNGNLVQDLNKGLKSIRYNHLNLVEQVELQDGRTLTYRYDASGVKLSKTVTPAGGGTATTTHYVGGVEYEAQQGSPLTLQLLAHPEGRVTKGEEGAFHYEYHLKDHLGNVRVSFAEDKATTAQASAPKVKLLQAQSYYAFGGLHPAHRFVTTPENRYLYNGKEYEDKTGFYNYGWRNYDPWAARWWNEDPLGHEYEAWSPYNYVMNNPVRNTDPDGRWVKTSNIFLDPMFNAILYTRLKLAEWNVRVVPQYGVFGSYGQKTEIGAPPEARLVIPGMTIDNGSIDFLRLYGGVNYEFATNTYTKYKGPGLVTNYEDLNYHEGFNLGLGPIGLETERNRPLEQPSLDNLKDFSLVPPVAEGKGDYQGNVGIGFGVFYMNFGLFGQGKKQEWRFGLGLGFNKTLQTPGEFPPLMLLPGENNASLRGGLQIWLFKPRGESTSEQAPIPQEKPEEDKNKNP